MKYGYTRVSLTEGDDSNSSTVIINCIFDRSNKLEARLGPHKDFVAYASKPDMFGFKELLKIIASKKICKGYTIYMTVDDLYYAIAFIRS